MVLKVMIGVLGAVALVVVSIAVIKVQDSQRLRIEKMTQNLDSIRKMRNGKSGYAGTDYISSEKNLQEKWMWGGGKSGGREQ